MLTEVKTTEQLFANAIVKNPGHTSLTLAKLAVNKCSRVITATASFTLSAIIHTVMLFVVSPLLPLIGLMWIFSLVGKENAKTTTGRQDGEIKPKLTPEVIATLESWKREMESFDRF